MASMNVFTQVQLNKPKQSRFDLSHEVKMSFKMGRLTPVLCEEIIPGDKISVQPNIFLRMAPMLAPVMHRVKVQTDFYFVPNRLLWKDFGQWITGDLDVEHPYAEIDDSTEKFALKSVGDYLGFPTLPANSGETIKFNPMPIAAYKLIWDEYYRDQNLLDPTFVPLVAGDNGTNYAPTGSPFCFPRAWQHDYFTSCLPFAQKGDDVLLPLVVEEDIPVDYDNSGGTNKWRNSLTGLPVGAGVVPDTNASGEITDGGANTLALDPNGSMSVDVQAKAVTINTLRRAFRLQEFLERSARGGTRYVEWLMSMFGVRSSDARLQRPEFLGRISQNVVFSEVLATAQETSEDIPVGQMAGHGISVGGGNTINLRAEEHGWMIGIISVMPDTAYQDGLPREFTRFDRFDYVNPIFANLGEQEVLNKEVWVSHTSPEGVFGYNPRYSEKRFKNSRVAGEFKTSLSFWHMGRQFEESPNLNGLFINADPTTRIFAFEGGDDNLYTQIYFKMSAVRKLPAFGIPTI